MDITSKQIGSVQEMVAQNNDFQKAAGVLRGNHYASSSSRIFYSELDYPARLDTNAWIETDKQFFLEYLPGVRQVITKLHAADFVAKTLRSGFNNAQLVVRKGEINAYIAAQAALRSGTDTPLESERTPTDASAVESLRRRAKGRKDFSVPEESDEFKSYYSLVGDADAQVQVPKTVEQLRSDLALEELNALEAARAIQGHHRPPMRPIFTSSLQAEGRGVGKIEEGLFQVHPNHTHGQPPHTYDVLPSIDPRFAQPRHVSADDRPSAQTNVLLAIDRHALEKMREAEEEAERGFVERKKELDSDTHAYNDHMRIRGAMYTL